MGSRRDAAQASVDGGCGRAALRPAYSGVSGRNAFAGWKAFDLQEGAVLSGAGDQGADHPGCDLRHADDDAQGEQRNSPGVARIQLLPAIEPSDYATREELMRAVRNAIAAALPLEMKPADYLTMAL